MITWFKELDIWHEKVKDIIPAALPNLLVTILTSLVPAIVELSVSFERYDFNNQEIDMRIIR